MEDVSWVTLRAFIFYLYTCHIIFTPPASNFTVELHSLTPASRPLGILKSRRMWLLARCKQSSDNESLQGVSPHAMYRLADKLDVPELKEMARRAIIAGFFPANVLYELISTFSHLHEEIQEAALRYACENWTLVKATPAFPRVIKEAHAIEGGQEILLRLLQTAPGLSASWHLFKKRGWLACSRGKAGE
ncbi:hypothetical protein JCM6882_002655 [Rhodosporidiobolus microsporus]